MTRCVIIGLMIKTIAITVFCIVLNLLACSSGPLRRESPVLFAQVCEAAKASTAHPSDIELKYTLQSARVEYGRYTGRRFQYADLSQCPNPRGDL